MKYLTPEQGQNHPNGSVPSPAGQDALKSSFNSAGEGMQGWGEFDKAIYLCLIIHDKWDTSGFDPRKWDTNTQGDAYI